MSTIAAPPGPAAADPHRGYGDDLALALDPARLGGRLGFRPDPWQADFLRSPSRRILLNCSRQVGKSTIVAASVVWGSLFDPGLSIILSPSERQSRELFLKITDCWQRLGQPVRASTENRLELGLRNGSRIVALPDSAATIRGFSGVQRLIVDEASRVTDELYHAVRPMLAVSGGSLVALSTPAGKRGWWHEAWAHGDGWARFMVPATDCPRIAPAFLAEERRALGPLFEQEYGCQFLDLTHGYFDHALIDGAVDATLTPAF